MSTPRIYSADEARALREAATPGPWAAEDGPSGVIIADIDGREVQVASAAGQAAKYDMRREHHVVRIANTALLAAAPDLAASAEHHSARADAAEVLVTEVERAQIAERRAADLAAQLDAAHAHIATLERVAYRACGYADDLGEKLAEREAQLAARDEADARSLRIETTLDPLFILRAVDEVHAGYVEPRTLEFLGAIRNAALARIGGSR